MAKYGKAYKTAEAPVYWGAAELAANTSHFGAPSARLALQIVCGTSEVPAELVRTAAYLYERWKNNQPAEFNACHFTSSRLHMPSCAEREMTPQEYKEWQNEFYRPG